MGERFTAWAIPPAELAESLSDPVCREEMRTYHSVGGPASSIGAALSFAIDQPAEVDAGEITVRPTTGHV
ncbi:hypothetical protein GCM10027162_12350 [Streptomyces incanus]